MADPVGFVGLGNMGHALAANLVASGFDVVTHDIAGADRNPDGATFAVDVATIAEMAAVVVFSLPDGRVSETVARSMAQAPEPSAHARGRHVDGWPRRGESDRGAALRRRDRPCRRAGVRRTGRGPRPHADGDVPGRRRCVRRGGAGAPRSERPPFPRGRRGRHGPGGQARQQLPVGHGAGRDERGGRVRHLRGRGHGHDARRPQRLERPECRDHRQVRRPRVDRHASPRASPTRSWPRT